MNYTPFIKARTPISITPPGAGEGQGWDCQLQDVTRLMMIDGFTKGFLSGYFGTFG